ncbi:glycosyltransferase [Clostridium botulinum]|nr:glycosyltransferase [Clostridium botulinum]
MNIEISVVIPIYNVERYLEKCLESVVSQNFDSYQVILVNDGSTDSSEKIAKKFVKKYKRFKIVNKTNAGLGAARNTGLQHCSGKYVVFIDSDDYIEKDYLYTLYNSVKPNNSDMAICSFEKIFENKNKSIVNMLNIDCDKTYSGIDTLKLLFKSKISCYAWDKIYKRKLFNDNNIKYCEGRLYEDIFTTIKLISSCRRISFVNKPLYKYRIRNGNITSEKTLKAINDFNYAVQEVNIYLKKNHWGLFISEEMKNFNITYMLSSLDMLCVYSNYKIALFYKKYKENFNNIYLNYALRDILFNRQINNWVKRDYILLKLKILPIKNKIRDKNI